MKWANKSRYLATLEMKSIQDEDSVRLTVEGPEQPATVALPMAQTIGAIL